MIFDDTTLPHHPVIRAAFDYIAAHAPADGRDDYLQNIIRSAEIIAAMAKDPEPDAIAASMIFSMLPFKIDTAGLVPVLGQGVVNYLDTFMDFDMEDVAAFAKLDAGGQQIVLANSIEGLQSIQDVINDGAWDYPRVKKALDTNGVVIEGLLSVTSETAMAGTVLDIYRAADQALAALVRQRQAAFDFEKTGLPDHPTIRAVFEMVKKSELTPDHPYGQRFAGSISIAKLLVDTKASSDPDVIAAALLNQYYAKDPQDIARQFSDRLCDLYLESSMWLPAIKDKEDVSAEGLLLRMAHRTTVVERLSAYDPMHDPQSPKFVARYAERNLEMLESQIAKLEAAFDDTPTTTPMILRMMAAAENGKTLLHKSENIAIRKPGAPPVNNYGHG